jgi:septal ring factor EnvC (AmiA/AmiB activator)
MSAKSNRLGRVATGFLLAVGLLTWRPAMAQQTTQKTRQQLEGEKKKLQEKIAQISRVLTRTSSRKEATLGQLKALNQQIESKTKQINLLSQDLQLLKTEVGELRQTTSSLASDLAGLRKEYAAMVYAASKTSNAYNKLSFLFSAPSFNALVMRYRYLRQYGEARRAQVRQIEAVRSELLAKQRNIEQKQNEQQQVLTTRVQETQNLEGIKQKQTAVVSQLSQRETQLQAELEARRQAANRLENAIAAVIEREIREARIRAEREKAAAEAAAKAAAARAEAAARAAREREAAAKASNDEAAKEKATKDVAKAEEKVVETREAVVAAETKTAAPNRVAMTEEEVSLASSFAASKNRLPWPVKSGFVSDHFGVHDHAVLRGVKVENHGIDIQTDAGEPVRAVYDGVVRDVSSLPGMGSMVAIQHGEYFTIYAKLGSVSVREGQKVKAREPIGTVAADSDGTAELQFQVWKNYSKLNPEAWLMDR